jgi:hypothetical protein
MLRTLTISAAMGMIAACATVDDPRATAPTLSVNSSGYNVEGHKGRTVRVCGRLAWVEGRWAVQHVQRPGEFFLHGLPAVFVAGCGGAVPTLDRNGCVTGRVTRENGTLDESRRVVTNDSPWTHYWIVHPQCGSER